MIVKDKELTYQKANQASDELLEIIKKKSLDFPDDADAAEQIYFICHIMGNLMAKVILSLQGYGEAYGVENLNSPFLINYIKLITEEHINHNMSSQKRKSDKKA